MTKQTLVLQAEDEMFMIIHAERIQSVVAHVETEVIETFWSFLGCSNPLIRTVIRVCVQTDNERTLGKFEVDPARAQDVLNDLLSQIPSSLQDEEEEHEEEEQDEEEENEEEEQVQEEHKEENEKDEEEEDDKKQEEQPQ